MKTEEIYKRALEFQNEGNFSEALPLYSKLIDLDDDPRFFIAYGVCLQKAKHWEQSVKQLEKGISLKPHYCEGDARLFLAESYMELGDKKKAVEQWKIVAKMEPEYPSYDQVPNEAKEKLKKYA